MPRVGIYIYIERKIPNARNDSLRYNLSMKIYNTLSRQLEDFVPLENGKVKLYTCGPTVYHYAHIGNLRAFIFYDTLKRTLLGAGYDVTHVMNITDVGHLTDDADYGEDKLEKGARREGKSVWDVARYFTDAYLRDVKLLNILAPTHQPKATEFIKEQIEMVKELERKGFTYRTAQGIAFDTSKFADYAKLSKMPMDKLIEGARVESDPEKKNLTDFYLWKFSQAGEQRQMEWESPWGVGFPGWHIECSAMAKELLGKTIDIHCGGIDHITVHHTNEIAQSECANDVLFAKYWMHNNFLNLDSGLKMSKSADNFLRMQTILDEGYHPLAYRYMCLTAHYRSELVFSWEQVQAAQQTLRKIKQLMYGHPSAEAIQNSPWVDKFKAAMEDDLNTPQALAVLHDMLSADLDSGQKVGHLLTFDAYLGLGLSEDTELTANLDTRELQEILVYGQTLQELIQQRNEARLAKDWTLSDRLRDQIKSAGYDLEDTPEVTKIPRGLVQ